MTYFRTSNTGTLLMFHHFVETQINPADDPNNANAASNLFFFDKNSDCNGPIRNLYGLQGTIRGSDLTSQRLGPNKCMIRLKSEQQFDGVVLDIEVKAMNILDCLTQVAIYDGDGEQITLMSYDCRSNMYQNRKRFFTSGNTATFVMTRQNVNSYSFDIEITVNPVRSGQDPNYENSYGKDNPYAFDKFPQEYIVGILSGFYLFIIVICLVVILYKLRHFSGVTKKWETHQLATLKAGSGFDVRSQMTQRSQIATLDGTKSRGPASHYSHGPTQPTVPSEDGDSGVYYNDDNYQKRRLVSEQKVSAKPTYKTNSVYSEPEDAPENFQEKVIVPTKHKGKNNRPPSYAEAVSDHTPENSSDEESEVSSSNASVRKKPPSSDDDHSSERSSVRTRSSDRSRSTARTRTTHTLTASESEEESHSSDRSSSRNQARARGKKPRQKNRPASKKTQRPAHSQQSHHQPVQQMQQPPLRPPMYGAYPPGQYVPVMAGPPQFHPVPMAQGYFPPRYSNQPQNAVVPPRGPQVQPTDIPVYSYLVQRGYKPIDTSASQVSSGSGENRHGEPDLRLDSGVEYMKR
ncbi:hypothetical protein Btru_010646 [Bulinus truncatus]|nr:hypothetical protein Btru_010646 [Bulinus truncatus]